MLSYFNRLDETSQMERSSLFMQTKPDDRSLADLLFVQGTSDFFPGNLSTLLPQFFIVRRERQTFRRLPKSKAIVFTVKTSIQPLTDLSRTERLTLAEEIKRWPADIATYKGRDIWQTAVLGFCEGKSVVRDDESVFVAGTEADYSD